MVSTFIANFGMVFVAGFLITCVIAILGRGITFIEKAIDERLALAKVRKGLFWFIVWVIISLMVSLSHIGS